MSLVDRCIEYISKDYEVVSKAGEGTFGQVFKALHINTKEEVAIKVLGNIFQSDYQARQLIGELQILRKLSSIKSNVYTTQLFDVIVPDFDDTKDITCIIMVMNYVETDLKKVLNQAD